MKGFALTVGVMVGVLLASFAAIVGIDWITNRTRAKRDGVQKDVDDVFRQDKAREAQRRDLPAADLNRMWDEEEGL
jgi:hypothetical protein